MSGDNVARQHQMVFSRMTLDTKKRKQVKVEQRIKWWKLKMYECCTELKR